MNFSKTEIKNILNMLLSQDKENSIIAFSCINNFSTKKHLGELLVLYQFGRTPGLIWEENCKKGFKYIKKVFQNFIFSCLNFNLKKDIKLLSYCS